MRAGSPAPKVLGLRGTGWACGGGGATGGLACVCACEVGGVGL